MSLKDVAIVLTTYNPDAADLELNVNTYKFQVGKVIVCDNSDCPEAVKSIEKLCSFFDNFEYLAMGGNKGIACAQNKGVARAVSDGFEYVIEMDQDSRLPENYVLKIYSRFHALLESNIAVAGLGPIAISKSQGFIYHGFKANTGVVPVAKTLSSGFFYPKYVFEIVGGKDEGLFIDYVDWDWCWRARRLGLVTFVDTDLCVEHQLGAGHKRILNFHVGLPAPVRLYYQYRNGLYMMRRSYVPLSWKMKRLLILFIKIPFYVLFTDKRLERLSYIRAGILDFLKGKEGRVDSYDA